MPFAAAVAAAGAIGGAIISSDASRQAAHQQADAANAANQTQLQAQNQAIQFQRDALNQQRELNKPFMDTGTAAMYQLADLLGVNIPGRTPSGLTPTEQLQRTPGYQFQFGQGQQAIESSAAARGMQLSGANLKALERYGQDYASTAYQQQLANLGGLTNIGLSAANNVGGAIGQFGAGAANTTLSTGQNIAGNIIGAGNASAAGTIGQSNAISQGLQNVAGSLGQYFGNVKTPAASPGFTLDPNLGNIDLSGTTFGSSLGSKNGTD